MLIVAIVLSPFILTPLVFAMHMYHAVKTVEITNLW